MLLVALRQKLLTDSLWNLAGTFLPLLAALGCIPIMIGGLGAEKYGFIAIAWALIGYMGLFDLGVGRAMTYVLSRHADDRPYCRKVVWTGISTLFGLGTVLALAMWAGSQVFVGDLLKVPTALESEAIRATRVVGLALPFVLVSTGLTAVLEAAQKFRDLNLLTIPSGTLTYVVPVLTLRYTASLDGIVLAMLVGRLSTAIALFILCSRLGAVTLPISPSRGALSELLRVGGWMTITNIVSPIMVNMDRLFVGAMLNLSSVAHYVTPFEIASKITYVPSAISRACFPQFAQTASLGAGIRLPGQFLRALTLTAVLTAPLCVFVAIFATDILSMWINPQFATKGAPILRLLCLGMLINAMCYIPYALIQAAGRARVTAQFHLVELIAYVPMLFLFLRVWGLSGVAVAWIFRSSLDACLLYSYIYVNSRR